MDKDTKMKNKFMIGDRVRVIGNTYNNDNIFLGYQKGSIITIVNLMDGDGHYWTTDGSKQGAFFSEHKLDHCRIRATKIARKVYKNKIIREEKGWLYVK